MIDLGGIGKKSINELSNTKGGTWAGDIVSWDITNFGGTGV